MAMKVVMPATVSCASAVSFSRMRNRRDGVDSSELAALLSFALLSCQWPRAAASDKQC